MGSCCVMFLINVHYVLVKMFPLTVCPVRYCSSTFSFFSFCFLGNNPVVTLTICVPLFVEGVGGMCFPPSYNRFPRSRKRLARGWSSMGNDQYLKYLVRTVLYQALYKKSRTVMKIAAQRMHHLALGRVTQSNLVTRRPFAIKITLLNHDYPFPVQRIAWPTDSKCTS